MARGFFHQGLFSGVDVPVWVAADSHLSGFRDRLTDLGVSRREAQRFVENLLWAVLHDFSAHYDGHMSKHLDRIAEIRQTLEACYSAVLTLDPNQPIPGHLQPENLSRLFEQLESHLRAVEGRTATRHLRDAQDMDTENLDALLRREAGEERQRTLAESAPDILLDDPELARIEMEYMHLPEHQRKWVALRLLALERRVSMSEQQRVGRLAYRERLAFIPEDRRLRLRLEIQAGMFSHFHMPGGWEATLRRLPAFGEANIAQLQRLQGLDQLFLANGYELRIRGPNGVDFMPDGVRFLDGGRTRYQFLEHKEPLRGKDRSFFDTEAGRRKLRETLERYAAIASALHGNGCVGFMWSTGQKWLDTIIAEEIGHITRSNPALGQFLLLDPGAPH